MRSAAAGGPLRGERAVAADHRAEVVAADEPHDEVRRDRVGRPTAWTGHDVRVLDGGRGARLGQEAPARDGILRGARAR